MIRFHRHPGFQRTTAAILLSAYLVASMGVLPSPRVVASWFGKLIGERYPCEKCGCGCATATECWTHCCCHSEQERLVWALENGVLPPANVEFTDAQWIAAANTVKPGSAHCGSCVEQMKGDLSRGIAMAPIRATMDGDDVECSGSCCGESLAKSEHARAQTKGDRPKFCCSSRQSKQDDDWAPGFSALSCKGLNLLLSFSLPPTPPVRMVEFILPEPAPFSGVCTQDSSYRSRTLDVGTPPPRSV